MTAPDAESIAVALGGWRGQRPAEGPRGWMCRCPAHDDTRSSLSVANGNGGRLLLHCFAACRYEDIRAALVDRGLLAERDQRPLYRRPTPFRVSIGDELMLANITEDDRVLSAAWASGNVELFASRFAALKRGCEGPDMAARCSILALGPNPAGFFKALFAGGGR